MGEALPVTFTVEEAARILRIGRTKAYAMAQEWRATGGQSGLPVIDFGNVLRVPLCKLEELLGGPLLAEALAAESPATPATPAESPPSPEPPAPASVATPAPDAPSTRAPRPTQRRARTADQPALPFAS
jgi:hypothetical protein